MSSAFSVSNENNKSVQGVPTFMNFEYSYNWVSMLTVIMLIYTFLGVFILSKIVYFYFSNRAKIKKVGLRIEIFQAFLLMQFWNILLITGDYLTCRIPYTSLFTSYCASENPQVLLKIVSFFYYFCRYSSPLFTVMFCGLRVAIMYSLHEEDTKKAVHIFSFVIIPIALFLALPNFISEGVCIPLGEPNPFGSILIVPQLHLSYSRIIVCANLAFNLLVTLSIIILTGLMVRKVRMRKTIVNSFQVSVQNANIENTLTTTMFILLIPLVLNLLVSVVALFQLKLFSYVFLLRPLFLDARVHIVTCYFYLTHPVFKTDQVIGSQASVLHSSRSKLG